MYQWRSQYIMFKTLKDVANNTELRKFGWGVLLEWSFLRTRWRWVQENPGPGALFLGLSFRLASKSEYRVTLLSQDFWSFKCYLATEFGEIYILCQGTVRFYISTLTQFLINFLQDFVHPCWLSSPPISGPCPLQFQPLCPHRPTSSCHRRIHQTPPCLNQLEYM